MNHKIEYIEYTKPKGITKNQKILYISYKLLLTIMCLYVIEDSYFNHQIGIMIFFYIITLISLLSFQDNIKKWE